MREHKQQTQVTNTQSINTSNISQQIRMEHPPTPFYTKIREERTLHQKRYNFMFLLFIQNWVVPPYVLSLF